MPELPEVQTVASEMHVRLAKRTIIDVTILWPRTIGSPSEEEFKAGLQGVAITHVDRRAKYILIHLDGGAMLVVHLRMTGRISVDPATSPRDPHTRLVLHLQDGEEIRFADTRKFGRWSLVAAGEAMPLPSFAALGPEPLSEEFTPAVFAERVKARRGGLKAALLDQRLVAGLGNIYVDEALFRAHIHPQRTLQSLDDSEILGLHGAIVAVLAQAVGRGGTTFSDYRTTWGREGGYGEELRVFRRTSQPCPTCGTPIERIVVAGRGTHFCPHCQPRAAV